MAPLHKGCLCLVKPLRVLWRTSPLGKEMKRFKSFLFNITVTLWTSLRTVDTPTPKRQLIVRHLPGVAYYNITIAISDIVWEAFFQFVVLRLRLCSISCKTNWNIFRDIRTCCQHRVLKNICPKYKSFFLEKTVTSMNRVQRAVAFRMQWHRCALILAASKFRFYAV